MSRPTVVPSVLARIVARSVPFAYRGTSSESSQSASSVPTLGSSIGIGSVVRSTYLPELASNTPRPPVKSVSSQPSESPSLKSSTRIVAPPAASTVAAMSDKPIANHLRDMVMLPCADTARWVCNARVNSVSGAQTKRRWRFPRHAGRCYFEGLLGQKRPSVTQPEIQLRQAAGQLPRDQVQQSLSRGPRVEQSGADELNQISEFVARELQRPDDERIDILEQVLGRRFAQVQVDRHACRVGIVAAGGSGH